MKMGQTYLSSISLDAMKNKSVPFSRPLFPIDRSWPMPACRHRQQWVDSNLS
jgi:hypothetical protein